MRICQRICCQHQNSSEMLQRLYLVHAIGVEPTQPKAAVLQTVELTDAQHVRAKLIGLEPMLPGCAQYSAIKL